MSAVWQVSHALPVIVIKDPLLKSIVHWLRPDACDFGRKWSADEAKRLYLSLRDLVIEKEVTVINLLNSLSFLFYLFIFFQLTFALFCVFTDLSKQVLLDSGRLDCEG